MPKQTYYEGQEFHNPNDPSAPTLVYQKGRFVPKQGGPAGIPSEDQIFLAKDTLAAINDIDAKNNGWGEHGVVGSFAAKHWPGSKAYDLDSNIDTLKARNAFSELARMRAASPTGGALGAVSEQELKLLQAASSSLDIGQSREQMDSNLNRQREKLLQVTPGLTQGNPVTLPPGQSRNTIPKGLYYLDPQGNVRRNDNGDAGNPVFHWAQGQGPANAPRIGGGSIAGAPRLPAAQSGPKVGAIEDGHRFNGGNPADPKSWTKVN